MALQFFRMHRQALAQSAASQQIQTNQKVVPKPPDNRTTIGGQAFPDDLRSESGLGLGDGLHDHTSKWKQDDAPGQVGNKKSPMQYCFEAEPIEVHGAVVASYGSENAALGCPVEYINLKGTSRENPAVCKYTGNKRV
eukprot:jgi/Astpho2/2001/Aster-x1053